MSAPVPVLAHTRHGSVEGRKSEGLSVFKGIRYASLPGGRWSMPADPIAWSGTYCALDFGPSPPQLRSLFEPVLGANDFAARGVQSEDCLSLNIWTPDTGAGDLPVMVWFPGGGFRFGSASVPLYDCGELARDGQVVLVTVNYRVGPLGFLRLIEATNGAISSTGNEGIHDQIQALKWVRDNIRAFGGDPENVTIFGESAGAASVSILLASPVAKGLFHKAILQSGVMRFLSVEEANATSAAFLALLAEEGSHWSDLRNLPWQRLVQAGDELLANVVTGRGPRSVHFFPVVDGSLINSDPFDLLLMEGAQKVPILVGSNLDEWNVYAALLPQLEALDEPGLLALMTDQLGAALAQSVLERYRTSYPDMRPDAIFRRYQTERVFGMHAERFAERYCEKGRVYRYLFCLPSPLKDGSLGAFHGTDVPLVFGSYRHPEVRQLSGDGDDVRRLSGVMQHAWAHFAHTGSPSLAREVPCRAYESSERHTILFAAQASETSDPYRAARQIWSEVPDELLGRL